MENFALIALVENLRNSMSDLVIRRIIQHQPSGFIFQTRSTKLPAFKIIADMQNPALYGSETRPPLESPNDAAPRATAQSPPTSSAAAADSGRHAG